MSVSDPVVEAEFTIQNTAYPFTGASKEEDCVFELAKLIPRSNEECAEFFNVVGTEPEQIQALTNSYESVDATLLREYEHGGLFEFLVSEECPAVRLANLGALPHTVQGIEGEGRIVAEISPKYDAATVIETFLDEHPDAELVSKQEKSAATPLLTESAFQELLQQHLTDRQYEVLHTAFEAGYYDWPRDCTGKEIAEELGISSATFSEHIHAAERNLLGLFFDQECQESLVGY